jgi:tryptophanyl-tRNA synthetase
MDDVWEKLRPAVTDPKRIRRTDPGTPEVCNIYHLHRAVNPPDVVENVAKQCRSAGWGCIDCKRVLFDGLKRELEPIQARAAELASEPGRVDTILAEGAEAAGRIARETMREVKGRMGLS